jgi:SAM-dependent methyltransferase
MVVEDQVAAHYGRSELQDALLSALKGTGKDVDNLTLDDLAPIDEFHVRGQEATLELGRAMNLSPNMQVLDVGSGLGGPSRRFASVYGCRITGVDLTAEYCDLAEFLAERLGVSDLVTYRHGSALDMPFEAASFDAAYTQHVAMNIADKSALYREVARVLKPGTLLGIYDLLQGEGGGVVFPVPWARTPDTSFLVSPSDLRSLLEGAGFEIVDWSDTTDQGREWFVQLRERMQRAGVPPVTFQVLMGDDFPQMAENQLRNLIEGRVAPTQIICKRL